jgi:hypothetical protein
MKELKIEKFIEREERGKDGVYLAIIETGGFAIISKINNIQKVCFQPSFGSALEIYIYTAGEILGGPGMLWYN